MSLKLVDCESLNGDVKKYHYVIRGLCRFRPDSGEREFRSVLGPTRNKLQRKLPEMKLKKKKKKHMKSKYEKTKKLGTPASPTTTLKQRKTQKRKKLFVAQARSEGITLSDFSVVSNVFKKKQDSEQSTAELALEKFLSADHPLGSYLRATLQRDGERHSSFHVMSSLHLIQRSTITIKLSILQLIKFQFRIAIQNKDCLTFLTRF
ncbi:hypothetical protein HID58_052955 [Brassica napus]|uniref:Uncharacterized protein n=1 Tax=Brassica napus TaxID=3708 RepID=A0ABQ8AEF7_BRANA|nr:hypothetical protein HID58_052955 [Brassica napus]